MSDFRSEKAKWVVGLLALFLLLGFSSAAFAQGTRGAIAGTVKDTTGAVVVGAKVDVENQATNTIERTATSGSDGRFSATLLPVGVYHVSATAPGFAKTDLTGVEVRITETVTVTLTMKAGAVTEVVEVHAAATLINPENATTGQPISGREMVTLPLSEPNYLFLLALSPGTAGEPTDVRKAGRAAVDISVGGQRTSNNSVSMEGININDFNLAHFDYMPLPSPEAIQEFKVATSLFDATLGSKGGANINLVLKTGTDKPHFDAWWQFRNTDLNADEWFRKKSGQDRGVYNQNVIGLDAGGKIPVVKGFGYVNVQGLRARNGIDPTGSAAAPTLPDFPQNPDGTTSAALLAAAFNLNPANIDPVAVNILNQPLTFYGGTYFIPRHNQSGCATPISAGTPLLGDPDTFECAFSKVGIIDDTQYTMTYDRPFRNNRDKLMLRWFYDDGASSLGLRTATTLPWPRADFVKNRFATIGYTWQISPRQLNEVRLGYNRFRFGQSPTDLVSMAQIGSTRSNTGVFPGMFETVITSLFSSGVEVNDDRGTVSNQYVVNDNWSMTVGKHNLRAGGEIIRHELNRFNNFAVRGILTFGSAPAPNLTNCQGQADGDCTPWQDFLLGRVTGIQSGSGSPLRYFRASDAALFFQDDWHVFPRLTVNLGMRWEPMQFSHDLYFRNPEFDPNILMRTATSRAMLFPEAMNINGFLGDPGVSDCAVKHCWDLNNFAPRVGFAWDVFGNQRTVLRGGYGVYFQRLSNQNILQGSLGAPFFIPVIRSFPNPALNTLGAPLPATSAPALIDPAYIPQRSFFAGINASGPQSVPIVAGGLPVPGTVVCTGFGTPTAAGTLNGFSCDQNDPASSVIFVNPAGIANPIAANICQISGGSALNCDIDVNAFTAVSQNMHAPYTQQWNLTLQRELTRGWAVEVGYVGSHNVGGLGSWWPFRAAVVSPASPKTVTDVFGNSYTITTNTFANETLREQAIGMTFQNSGFSDNIGFQTYHSLQAVVSHRLQGGLFFQAAYTFSRNIDNVSGSVGTDEFNPTFAGQGGGNLWGDPGDFHQARALSDLDRRHRLSVTWDYLLPVFKGHGLLGGWGVSGLVTLQSGQRFSVTSSSSGNAWGGSLSNPLNICKAVPVVFTAADLAAGFGAATCTPGAATDARLAVTTGPIESRLAHYINPNFFSPTVNVPFSAGGSLDNTGTGDLSRNIFAGPFQQSWDFSVYKQTRIGERHLVSLRADFFNIFNHPIFNTPSSTSIRTSSTFGRITSTVVPARLIQFGVKYSF